MSLAKKAQYNDQDLDLEGFNAPRPSDMLQRGTYADPLPVPPGNIAEPLPIETPGSVPAAEESAHVDDSMARDFPVAEIEGEIIVEIPGEEDQKEEFSFTLPLCPGSDSEDDFEPADIKVEEKEEPSDDLSDPWNWGGAENFLPWLSKMMNGVPKHSGRDASGVERAIGHLEEILKVFPKAMRADKNGVIDVGSAEKARDEVYKGLDRLHERLDKLLTNKYPRYNKKKTKKAADENLVKKAQKSTHVGGIIVTVPLLISGICRAAINSMVSAGKDIEDVFDKLAKEYDLSAREEFEAMQLLADMGYPVRRPRGIPRDQEVDTTSTDNPDWMANYPG